MDLRNRPPIAVPTRMNSITYFYRGAVERGTGTGYAWRNGFSETTPDGKITYPWMTAKECRADARARGAVARFETPPVKLEPKPKQ